MTDKTQATAHAEITAPISADLRRIERTSPVSQAVRLLREAAAELKNCHTIGGDWGDEIEALDAYNEHMAVAATLEQAEAGQAVPAPVTYMATDNACKWAWDQVREEVGTEGWTAGDSCTFYGFFLWGWNYRGQYETQRPAAPPAPAAVAVPAEILDALGMTGGEVDDVVVRIQDMSAARHDAEEARDELATTPAQEHATQLAGQDGEQDEGLAQAIDERDTAEGWADGLAGLIAAHFGQDIGEHSSAHNPWQEAKDIIEEAEPYRPAAAPAQAQEDARDADSAGRTDSEIVEQTEELAKFLLAWKWGLAPESASLMMRNSENTKAQKAWNAACEIQELLTATDVENAVSEVDDAARAAQGGTA